MQLFVGCHGFVLPQVDVGNEGFHLGEWGEVHVVPQVGEKSRRDPPEGAVASVGIFILNLVDDALGILGVDHFVEAVQHVATSDMLEHSTSLQQEAALGHLNDGLGPVA